MSVQELSPVGDLLEQWLLLPLFADLGMMALVLRNVRNRTGYALAALLGLLAAQAAASTWPGAPGARETLSAGVPLVPAALAVFTFSYAGGRRLSENRHRLAAAIVLPAGLMAAFAAAAGVPAADPAINWFALALLGGTAALLGLTGAWGSLSGSEPATFLAAFLLLCGFGPVYGLALPAAGLDLRALPYAAAGAGALLTMATVRYKAFSEEPREEGSLPGGRPLEPGLYYSGSVDAARARSAFIDAVRHGAPGAAFTRTHPAAWRRRTGLGRVPVIWLAQSSYERSLPPGDVGVLSHTLRDMGEQRPGCAVLIEDVDYLVANAGHYRTVDVLGEVRELAGRTSMAVLLSSELLTDEERGDLRRLGARPLPRDGPAAELA